MAKTKKVSSKEKKEPIKKDKKKKDDRKSLAVSNHYIPPDDCGSELTDDVKSIKKTKT